MPNTPTSDVLERLRLHSTWRDSHGELNDAPNEAAATIERLSAELERRTEALTVAIAALGRVNVRCFDRQTSPLKPLGDIAREALSEVMRTLGDTAYDEIVRAALTEKGIASERT